LRAFKKGGCITTRNDLFCFLCMVKVLLLHQHFNVPQKGGAVRSYYLAKALVDRGIAVIVITGHNEPGYHIEHVDGIEVHCLPVKYHNRFGFYKRGFSFMRFVTQTLRLSSRLKDLDLCYAISVPLTVGIAAMRISKRHSIPFLFEVGDLWPDAPVQLGFIRNGLLKKSLYAFERKIYKESAGIVALSTPIKSAVESKAPGKPVYLIPNMADTDFFNPVKKNEAAIARLGVEGKFVVSYIGATGFANGLDYFLECARVSAKALMPVHFFICGGGAMLEGLKKAAQQLSLSNLTFIPFRNRDGVRELLDVTDANFVCYRTVPVLETGSPNKYFDGLAAGKLTIVNFGGWMKDEIEAERCGFHIDPKQPADFVDKLTPFLRDGALLNAYGNAARRLAERKYSRKILSEKFFDIVSAFRKRG
jgi:glycosyltransferase involved in cell wall biosynthesis